MQMRSAMLQHMHHISSHSHPNPSHKPHTSPWNASGRAPIPPRYRPHASASARRGSGPASPPRHTPWGADGNVRKVSFCQLWGVNRMEPSNVHSHLYNNIADF
eukprot:scaffold55250_cov34-Tisochrysis_lutea.AAC.1